MHNIRFSKSFNTVFYSRKHRFKKTSFITSFFIERIKFIRTVNQTINISKNFIVHIERLFSTIFISSHNRKVTVDNIAKSTNIIELFKSNIIMDLFLYGGELVVNPFTVHFNINRRIMSITINTFYFIPKFSIKSRNNSINTIRSFNTICFCQINKSSNKRVKSTLNSKTLIFINITDKFIHNRLIKHAKSCIEINTCNSHCFKSNECISVKITNSISFHNVKNICSSLRSIRSNKSTMNILIIITPTKFIMTNNNFIAVNGYIIFSFSIKTSFNSSFIFIIFLKFR